MLKTKELPEIKGAFPQCGPVTFGHMDYKELRRQGVVKPEFHQSALSFAFVRNPFDRAVSLYFYSVRVGRFQGTFPQFVDALERGIDPIGLFHFKRLSQCNPQADWLFDDDESLAVDHLFRMERFGDDVKALAELIGIPPLVLHVNTSPRAAPLAELLGDTKLRKRVAHFYRRDFELLGYDATVLPPDDGVIG